MNVTDTSEVGWVDHVTDLVDVVTRDCVVECTVEIIQQFDDLYRTTFRRQHCKPDDIREVDRCARIHLRSHTTSRFQFVGHKTIKQHKEQGPCNYHKDG